jgi:hypothetical protein
MLYMYVCAGWVEKLCEEKITTLRCIKKNFGIILARRVIEDWIGFGLRFIKSHFELLREDTVWHLVL